MHTRCYFALILLLLASFTLSGQSLTGEWTYTMTTAEGDTLENLLVVNDDGTITIDIGTDGEVDVMSDYSIDGDRITVEDTREDSPCYGTPAVYQFVREGDTVTLTPVDEPCETRRQGAPTTMTLVE